MSEQKKMKASEKLKIIEDKLMQAQQRVGQLEMMVYNFSRESEVLKEATQLLHQKLDAVVNLVNSGGQLTENNINDAITKANADSLKTKTDQLVESGALKQVDEVTKDSFVVIRELDKDGKLVNPRLQFLLSRVVEEIQNKFVGKKVGDLVVGPEDKLDGEIMEIYDVVKEEQPPEVPVKEEKKIEAAVETEASDKTD